MRKLRLSSLLFIATLIGSALLGTSCGKSEKKNVSFDTVSVVTHEDSVRVFEVTKQFMDLMQQQQYDSAVNMLSVVSKTDSAFYLTPEQKQRVIAQFKHFPVLSYEILTSRFESPYNASATYKYKFMENKTNDPNFPCTMNLTIDVVYKTGKYRVVLQSQNKITR